MSKSVLWYTSRWSMKPPVLRNVMHRLLHVSTFHIMTAPTVGRQKTGYENGNFCKSIEQAYRWHSQKIIYTSQAASAKSNLSWGAKPCQDNWRARPKNQACSQLCLPWKQATASICCPDERVLSKPSLPTPCTYPDETFGSSTGV